MADTSAHHYFTASIWAEMKKTTAYKVDICVDQDLVISEVVSVELAKVLLHTVNMLLVY